MKHKILLVDAERRSVRVLTVALRSAGYSVRVAANGAHALDKIEAAIPDVIVSDSQLPKLDGYALVEKLKANRETENIPILLLTSKGPSEDRERGRRLGVSDYLPKPVFVRELVACIGLLIARSARAKIAASITASRTGRFSGSTRDVSVVDLLQTFELLRETGVARLLRGAEGAEIYFRDGRAVDARLGRLRGEQAVYAALLWSEAALDIEFKPVKKEDVIDRSIGTLLVEGMRRVDAWGQIYEQLRPLTSAVEVDQARLLEQIASRLSDGKALSGDRSNALLAGLGASTVVGSESSVVSQLEGEADEEEDEEADGEDDEHDEDGNADDDESGEGDRDEDEDTAEDEDEEYRDEGEMSHPVTSTARTITPRPRASASAPAGSVQESSTVTLKAPTPAKAPAATTNATAEGPHTPAHSESAKPAQTNGHAPHSLAGVSARGTETRAVASSRVVLATAPPAPQRALPIERERQHETHRDEAEDEPMALARERERDVAPKPVIELTNTIAAKPAADVAAKTRTNPLSDVAGKTATRPLADVAGKTGTKPVIEAMTALPSTPPWTQEVDSDLDPGGDPDAPIPGMRLSIGRTGMLLIGVGVALALVVGVVTGLRPAGASHPRTADEGRKPDTLTAAAAAAPIAHADAVPLVPTAAAPVDSAMAEPTPAVVSAPHEGASSANAAVEPGAAGLGLGPAPAGIDFHPGKHSALVSAAEQALMRGATDRALVLAGQAVTAAPADADAWLTLAAAHRAAGDDSAAHTDYRNCVAQAHTEGVNHCRVLAAH
jgi:DNA-binding response OmpR family regulator